MIGERVRKFFSQITKIIAPAKWLEQKQTSILSAAMVITVANLAASFAGLLRSKILIGKFFDTIASQQAYEAFLVAFQIPDLMFQLIIVGAVSASFIPVFTEIRKKKGEEAAFKMTSIVMNILLLAFVVVGVIIFIWAPEITSSRTGDGFTPGQVKIVIDLTRIMIVAQLFFAISCFFSGMLQSYRKFIMPALAPIFYNLGILAGAFLLYDQLGIYGAGIGVVFGAFLHMAVQWPQIKNLGWKHWWGGWSLKFPGVKKILRMMPPRVLTLGVNELQGLSIGFFTTEIGSLSFLIIQYARTLVALPIRFFGVPISQASLPFLAEEADENDRVNFRKIIIQSLNQISFLAVPASVLLLILRIPIVRLVYGTKNFPWETTVAMGKVVAIISLSIVAQAMYHLLVRSFYALRNTKIPFYISMAVTALFVGGCWLATFGRDDGQVYGIAIAIAVAYTIEVILYLLLLNQKVKKLLSKDLIWPQIKIGIAGVIMAIALYIPFKMLDQVVFDTTRVIPLVMLTGVTAIVGLSVYLLLAKLLRIKEMNLVWKILKGGFGKKKLGKVAVEVGAEEPMIGVSGETMDDADGAN